jgi:hypothetical protein
MDGEQSLSGLLRKCLVLAHELKDERLKAWTNQELNGYPSTEGIPQYRTIHTGAYGYFAGSFGAALTNYPIPAAALEKEPVSAYETAVTSDKSDRLRFDWPGNMVAYYQTHFFQERYSLISAWQDVPIHAVVALVDAVRNRTLNMALELKQELGSDIPSLDQKTPAEIQRVHETIVNNIYGGTMYFAAGESSLTAMTTNTQTVISVGDSEQLSAALTKAGLSQDDLQQLTEAMHHDGDKKLGARVLEWTKKNTPKMMEQGVKVGTKIGQEILTAWLKQYCGL